MKKLILCVAIAATFFAVSNLESHYYNYPYYSSYGYGWPYYGGVGAGFNVGPFGFGLFV